MRRPKVGQRAYISPIQGESLRNGWSRFLPVTVVSMQEPGMMVTVRDGGGHCDEIPHFQLDCGCDFHSQRTGWIPESDPRALRYVEQLLQEPAHENSMLQRGHEGYVRWLKHILGRNGWKEPAAALA